jgi:hypothetical protein
LSLFSIGKNILLKDLKQTSMSEFDSDEHYAWLVGARYKSQDLLRRLYAFWKGQGYGKDLLTRDHEREAVYTLFLGAAFSLWRAAFLSDTTRGWKEILEDSGGLLVKLLRDNAIGYPQDRDTKEWMGGYYLNNAMFRLVEVRGYLKLPESIDALREFDKIAKYGIEDKKSTESTFCTMLWIKCLSGTKRIRKIDLILLGVLIDGIVLVREYFKYGRQ